MATNIDEIAGAEEEMPDLPESEAEKWVQEQHEKRTEEETEQAAEAEKPAETGEKPAGEEQQQEQTEVPLGVLRQERERRQQLQRDLDAERLRVSKMEETFQQVIARSGQPAEQSQMPVEPGPSWDDDPDGWMRHQLESLHKRLDGQDQAARQTTEQQAQDAQAQAFMRNYQTAAAAYSQEKPDFQDAYNHLIGSMRTNLERRGFIDPTEREQALMHEEAQFVGRMQRMGRNPAEEVYRWAQEEGYAAKATGGNSAENAATSEEEETLNKLETLQRGANATAPRGGSAPSSNMTLERLSEMEGDDFDKAFEKFFNS